ncbi:uncharacterized protein [Physcomitrium patens]|uniref:Protein kinase domain-containing protein n=1 Tax=Physcomitrium patens TaxID=3218 RepID=A0A7I4B228_PHYPA|nr:proto-oncogene serine/threonine-protein kinase mos-like isoform X2 [Physcomitrium patens]|eukprot:XP_024399670.1 proto-oncogene serine/threonine-protein kinase mos-like isoform X2 [Physcomitrella patens]
MARVQIGQAGDKPFHEDAGIVSQPEDSQPSEFAANGASSFSSDQCSTSFGSTSDDSAPISSPYFSMRTHSLGQRRSDFASELDYKIQISKEHWSELNLDTSHVEKSKNKASLGILRRVLLGRRPAETSTSLHSTESLERSKEIFERLKRDPNSFFQDFDDLVLRGKIAEGGQAEIFEAECTLRIYGGALPSKCVVKVMKEGFSLQSLQSQWSPKMFRRLSMRPRSRCAQRSLSMTDAAVLGIGTSPIIGGTLLKDGRFAFVLEKYCGDLRNLIDLRMQEKGNRGPPFEDRIALRIVGQIARGMYTIHKSNLLHRDLKASNVLVERFTSGKYNEYPDCFVSDFECSVGVVGTGFWRAPEILLAVKNRSGAAEACTKKSDVYSFGMTCYEVLTGCVPFEGQGLTNYDIVLSGRRPSLPDYIDPNMRALLGRCWEADSIRRPSFKHILKVIASEMGKLCQQDRDTIPFHGWRSSKTWYLNRDEDEEEHLDSSPESINSPEFDCASRQDD